MSRELGKVRTYQEASSLMRHIECGHSGECHADGCKRDAVVGGLCVAHYARVARWRKGTSQRAFLDPIRVHGKALRMAPLDRILFHLREASRLMEAHRG